MDDARLIKAVLIVACIVVCFWLSETQPAGRNIGCRLYTIRNGEVSYRGRYRVARHRCNFGYILIGQRLATCVRGQWNKPRPVCASFTGCDPLQPPLHGFLLPSYAGALMRYMCDPGYTLIGSISVYCDGKEWNGTTATCVPAVQSPALSCNFEQELLCDWSQDTRDDFDWLRNQFSTPSGHSTGPSHDHTLGIGMAGHYMYIEASPPRRVNDTARLFSPVFQPGFTSSCFSFWYHMFGETIGSLRVYIKRDDEDISTIKPAWKRDGEQSPNWLQGAILIPIFQHSFQVVIEGIRGASFFGDIAIDDVNLQFESCQVETSTETAQLYSTAIPSTVSSLPISEVTTESTTEFTSVIVTDSPTTSTTAQPITYQTTESIDLFTTTHVSVTDTPIGSPSVADVITPSQLRSIDTSTSPTASTTTTDQLESNASTIPSKYRWRTKKQKNALAQVSKTPSGVLLAGVIVLAILISLAGAILFIYFKGYRFRKDKLSEDSDMRYLSSSEEIEYVDNYHNSSSLDELTVT